MLHSDVARFLADPYAQARSEPDRLCITAEFLRLARRPRYGVLATECEGILMPRWRDGLPSEEQVYPGSDCRTRQT